LREEYEAQQRQFHLTAGHLAPMYMAGMGTPGTLDPYAPETADPHPLPAVTAAEVARIFSDQPTEPAALTPHPTPKGTP
jgi:hypothetical protein